MSELAICTACGTQFPSATPPPACLICDDPRQFVPPEGQTWTSLSDMHQYRNVWTQDPEEPRMWSITTSPKFAIGQRCVLLQTEGGNVLWDCITFIDEDTINRILGMGGLEAIVISHPHYYSTHMMWGRIFGCEVWVAEEDEGWCVWEREGLRRLVKGEREEVLPGVVVAKLGGHFPGSLVCCWEGRLLVADTLVTTPSAYYHIDRPPGTTSYAFMWSIPNMIPLSPDEMLKMWRVLRTLEFESTHGAFVGTEVRDKNVKARVLESMKIQTRGEGYREHEILGLQWPE